MGCAVGKNDFGSVRFCKKNCCFRFGFGFTKLTAVSVFLVRLGLHSSVDVDAIFHLRLYGMTLEMTYFCAELVQLFVSRSDSELEVQRYGMKKSTLAVDPIMLQDELWMRQREKPKSVFQNRTTETEFSVFEFWGRFGSVFRKPMFDIFIGFRTSCFLTPFASHDFTCLFSSHHCLLVSSSPLSPFSVTQPTVLSFTLSSNCAKCSFCHPTNSVKALKENILLTCCCECLGQLFSFSL